MLKRFMAAAAALSLALAVGSVAQAQDKLKVAFMNVGPKTDGGWTQGHWTGVEMLMAELGDQIEVTFLESIPEGPDS
ncbi:MAG: BMP family ABC transporter substrate-binding protein, partial [Bauldia sp.]